MCSSCATLVNVNARAEDPLADIEGPGPAPGSLSDELLEAAVTAASERAAALEAKLESLIAARDQARREAHLLGELLAVRNGDETRTAVSAGGAKARASTKATRHPAVEQSLRELEQAGKPLHISELMRLLAARDVPIPGAGEQANLIAHLTRHPEVVRPSRGMYALRGWGVTESPPLKRATRKRVKGPVKGQK
jgi:hypothetical protein